MESKWSIGRWLGKIGILFQQPYRFRLPEKPLPAVQFRRYRENDLEVCSEIYRLNEPGRFPDGYYGHFRDFLARSQALFIVAEVEGRVIGFGGVTMYPEPYESGVNLNFGMIHPELHRRGYGTALLLARLAILPEPAPTLTIGLAPVELSQSFYARFGFRFFQSFRDNYDGQVTQLHAVVFDAGDWKRCRALVDAAGIKVGIDSSEIPRIAYEKKEPRAGGATSRPARERGDRSPGKAV